MVPDLSVPLEHTSLSNEPADAAAPLSASAPPPQLTAAHISCSRGLADWLSANQVSLAFTSYQTGRLYLVGVDSERGLAVHEVGTGRAMGLWADPQRLVLATAFQVWRFENILAPGQTMGDADRNYVPRVAHTLRRDRHPRHQRARRWPHRVRQYSVFVPGPAVAGAR
jgi:hypothetical protein